MWIGTLALLFGAGISSGEALVGGSRPNVVVIVTDDQGYSDYSHMGHGALRTPNLDRLASTSPQVDRFYVSAVCSPTRASLMTGRWNYRTRVVDTWIGRSMMEPDEVTLAEILTEAGFATGLFGKWHLGDCHPMRPMDQGFETSLVHRGGGLAQPSEPPENGRRYTDPVLFRNGEQVRTEGYCTDVFFDEARRFMESALEAERPFFAWVATNAPHDPFHDVPHGLLNEILTRDVAASLEGKSDRVDREARILAMLENLDANVGRLLTFLEEREIERETIVVFLSDNGPLWGRPTAGLRGHKTSPYEGGLRSRLFVRWPGRLRPHTRVQSLAAHVDLLPTILDLLDVPVPEGNTLDGVSLKRLFTGEIEALEPRHLFFQSHRGNVPCFEHHFAVVGPRYKLVRASGFGRATPSADAAFELFDLNADPGESRDLARALPDVVTRLRSRYREWFEDVSTTREDNWAPPRIRLDATAEPVVHLTRQDVRFEEGEGWTAEEDRRAAWHLDGTHADAFRLSLVYAESQSVDRVLVTIGDEQHEVHLPEGGVVGPHRLLVGSFDFPEGPFELRVAPFEGERPMPFHQVQLDLR